jgi:membrane protein DedA with SNARE-associated domain
MVVILLFAAIINSIIRSRRKFWSGDQKLNAAAIYALHTQILIGFILYFISPKVVFSSDSMSSRMLRFFLVEHIGLMLVAAVVTTVGYSISKRIQSDTGKHMRILIFYGIALLLILLAIPWPWQNYSSGWL